MSGLLYLAEGIINKWMAHCTTGQCLNLAVHVSEYHRTKNIVTEKKISYDTM